MSLLLRLLLLRGMPIAAILLLLVLGIVQSGPREQMVVAKTSSVVIRHDPAPAAIPDHVLLREIAIAQATPRPVPSAIPVRRKTAVAGRSVPAAGPAHPVSGAGQWRLINQDRAGAGLAPLQWNDCLASIATGQAARMAAQGYISHANGRYLDLGCHLGTQSGENIGFQGGGIDDASMNAWFMGDAPHRANILGPYHYVGAAWLIAPGGTAYLAVEFG